MKKLVLLWGYLIATGCAGTTEPSVHVACEIRTKIGKPGDAVWGYLYVKYEPPHCPSGVLIDSLLKNGWELTH